MKRCEPVDPQVRTVAPLYFFPNKDYNSARIENVSREGGTYMAFWASFLQYFIEFVVLVALAVAGTLLGIKLRKRKDAKLED
ncbi:MAG: hypothetical protein IJ567_00890 [Lachnospiraceae bacterium]|nr:hypothetical protein [Lachnospiraceae bacterium]